MSRSDHVMSTEEQARKEFLRIRIKFTSVVISIAAIVLATFLAIGAIGEYNSQMDFIRVRLVSAIEATIESEDVSELMDDVDISYVPSSTQRLGVGSDFLPNSYVPIALYKADYDNEALVPIDITTGMLSDEAMFEGTLAFLAYDDGYFHADREDLVCVKMGTSEGDLLAFTDASLVKVAVRSYIESIGGALLLCLFVLALVIWSLTSWMIRPLRDIWERQRVFIGNASHELKTPLTTIKANLALVEDGKCASPADEKRAISQALDETDRMIVLVKDLLDIATEKAFSAPKEDFDLSKLMQRQALFFEAKAFERGIMIDSADVEKGIIVYANEDNISTLIGILLDNACKYAYDSTEISIKLERGRKHAELRVINEGPEISEKMQREIFNRFVRIDEARTGNAAQSSYGLGLAMAQDIASASDGHITTYMQGTNIVFLVKIPLAR